MRVFECIAEFLSANTITLVIEDADVEAQFFQALRFYIGYQELYSHRVLREIAEQCYLDFQRPDIYEKSPFDGVEQYCTCVSSSEWAKIRPLFELYVERANAKHLEATRMYGVDVFGRGSSEVQTDITSMESEFPVSVFQQDFVSV